MLCIIEILFITFLFQNVVPQIHIGGRIASGLRNGVSAGTRNGLEGAIESANHLIGGAAGNLIGGAESIIGGTGGRVIGIFHGKNKHGDKVKDDIKNFDKESGSGRHEDGEHHKHGKYHWGIHGKNGRGIDRKSGIGSRGGILTPIEDALGLSHVVCQISNAGEGFIEKLGKFHLGVQDDIKHIDHAVADYITVKIVLRTVDIIRRGHNSVFDFFCNTHIAFVRFGTNAAVELYRVIKAPLREVLACN